MHTMPYMHFTARQPLNLGEPPLDLMQTYFATTTSQAVLRCPIQPGALVQAYYGRWARSGVTLAEIPEPLTVNSPQDAARSSARYDIDRNTFSLIINSVEAADAGDDYQCFLSVFNPIVSSSTIELRTEIVQLTLMVNGNRCKLHQYIYIITLAGSYS